VAAAFLSTDRRSDSTWGLVAAGAWTSANADTIDDQVTTIVAEIVPTAAVSLQMNDVTQFDTYGAWLLERLARDCRARGAKLEVSGLSRRFAGLADIVRHQVPDQKSPAPARWLPKIRPDAIQRSAVEVGRDLIGLLALLGAVTQALARSIVRPSTFRLIPTVHQLDRVAWQAVPIILLITFLIGGIIAQQGFFHFRKFGAELYVVDMVGILVLREIGVLLVAIMVAGRSGSSYTAELGSMKMREEIDALRTMGLDPVVVLILPRIIALTLALPALAFLGSISALYGGGLVAWVYGDMSPAIFTERLRDAVSLDHFKVGIIKAPFMAIGIGLVACAEGLKVKGSASSLGLKTTTSVVKSIFLVIVLDGLFAMYFSAIGM
jgi:phospholipid/cholesterol/gamma-HCH transport system permease protein